MRGSRFCVAAAVTLLSCNSSPSGDTADAGDNGVPGEWDWIPVAGSKCASGSTAGIGLNLSTSSDDLFIFMQGGGACWNQGTCVPSLLAHGPICFYNPTACLYDGPGGTQPMASYVTDADPFPADGGGAFPSELAIISSVRAFDRADESNPFREASFVYVPYCTGDLHGGDALQTYAYQHDLVGPEQQYTFHFAGATNMERYLEELAGMRPNAERVWLTGSSAGGYGATLNFERALRHFPGADVALLADSAPFVDTELHFETWRDTWNLQLPEDCVDCGEGFGNIMAHLVQSHEDKRLALLAYESDAVVRYFFHGDIGPDAALNPPVEPYASGLANLQTLFDAHAKANSFLLPGNEHVMWQGYGTRTASGGYTDPFPSPGGETDLKAWIDAWATGTSGWTSVSSLD